MTENSVSTLSLANLHKTVNDICIFVNPGKNNILARLSNHWDPSSWQCFQNEQELNAVTRSDLNNYCNTMVGGATAELQEGSSSPTAYDWKCEQNGNPLRISMALVCNFLY